MDIYLRNDNGKTETIKLAEDKGAWAYAIGLALFVIAAVVSPFLFL